MNIALIGLGKRGNKIVDQFLKYDDRTGHGIVKSAVAVDAADRLKKLDRVPRGHRVLIGRSGASGGVGTNNDLGAEVVEEGLPEIQNVIDTVGHGRIDAFLIVTNMGSGIGGGAGVLATHLDRLYDEPIYGLGVIPDREGVYLVNAARLFQPFASSVDNLLLFDDSAWRDLIREEGSDAVTEELVSQFGSLFAAGENTADPVESPSTASDVIDTLSCGGISTVGYASRTVESESGLIGRFIGRNDDNPDETIAISTLVREATNDRLALPCDLEDTAQALVVASGQTSHIDESELERGREWLTSELGSDAVRASTRPLSRSQSVEVVVLCSGLANVSRIDELQQVALAAKQQERREAVDELHEKATKRISLAKEARADGDFERAFEHSTKSVEYLEDARERVREHDLEDVNDVGEELEVARQLRTQIDRDRVSFDKFSDELGRLETRLDELESSLEDGGDDAALEQTDDVSETLADLDEQLSAHEFDELADRLDALRQRYESLTGARGEIQSSRQPAMAVPTSASPSVSLAYDDLKEIGPIGSGGNADVYRATGTTSEGEISVAVKEPRMNGTLHAETIDRFIDEAETWAKLDDDDHIVDIVDYGSQPLPWIAMEYMDAGHLGERISDFDLEQALWTAIATTEAVLHAHRRGVAHLDLKPENVLFRSVEDGWDVPKVADWGLSKHLLEHSASIDGLSPQYAAPEQFDDVYGPVDDITDIYQLGALFYEVFTGEPAYKGQPARVMQQVMNDRPTPPSEVADVPSELDEILLTAMATDREDRYEHVVYLRDELQALR